MLKLMSEKPEITRCVICKKIYNESKVDSYYKGHRCPECFNKEVREAISKWN